MSNLQTELLKKVDQNTALIIFLKTESSLSQSVYYPTLFYLSQGLVAEEKNWSRDEDEIIVVEHFKQKLFIACWNDIKDGAKLKLEKILKLKQAEHWKDKNVLILSEREEDVKKTQAEIKTLENKYQFKTNI